MNDKENNVNQKNIFQNDSSHSKVKGYDSDDSFVG